MADPMVAVSHDPYVVICLGASVNCQSSIPSVNLFTARFYLINLRNGFVFHLDDLHITVIHARELLLVSLGLMACSTFLVTGGECTSSETLVSGLSFVM